MSKGLTPIKSRQNVGPDLGPDCCGQNVGPDLGTNYLKGLSADDNNM